MFTCFYKIGKPIHILVGTKEVSDIKQMIIAARETQVTEVVFACGSNYDLNCVEDFIKSKMSKEGLYCRNFTFEIRSDGVVLKNHSKGIPVFP